ncbi:MAG: DUF3108 domain-containing protein [Cryobacterium sp.]|nr:DUF3108 domain-containing protein [Oligoflexia bacterium]
MFPLSRRWSLRWVLFTLSLTFIGGCASSQIANVEPLPKDLPADLQAKFEVVEAAGPAPAPSALTAPEATAIPSRPKKREKKIRAKAKPVVVEKEKFIFPTRRTKGNPIWVGEKQVLEITYIGLAAGDITMDVLPIKMIVNRKVMQIKATAVSSAVMNLFYRLNDTIESFWDYDGLFSHRFHLVLDEAKQKRDSLELYDSEKKQTYYWNRRNHVDKGNIDSKEYFDIPPFPQDSFSALYYLRTLPLEDGGVYSFPVVSEGKSWEAVATVVGREMMDTPLGKKKCIIVRPQTRYQGVLKQEKGDSFIWLTDDDRRFIVRLEAKVKIGSVAARLKKVELGEKPNEE